MKKSLLSLFAIITVMFTSCQSYTNVENAQLKEVIAVKDSVQLLDVRTVEEFNEKHIPSAINIDVTNAAFLDSAKSQLDINKEVAVYCKSGKRSAKAAKMLAKAGYKVSNLQNGITSWIADGYVVADKNDYIVFDGDTAPDFTTTIYQGGEIKLSDLRGKVVMLQFTASWCGICRNEMPHIEKDIWQKHKDNENFVLLAVDLKEGDANIAQMIEATGITYPVVYDTEAAIFNSYNLKGAGVTRNVLIDKEGKIVMRTRRFHQEEFNTLVAKIDELLK